MARQQFPMMNTGGGILSKLVGTVITLAFLAFVIKHPAEAAHWLTSTLGALGNVVDGLATFLTQVHS